MPGPLRWLRRVMSQGQGRGQGQGQGEAPLRVHLLIKGRVGEGWIDVDETLRLPAGATLSELLAAADRRGLPLRAALDESPHLRHTFMLNGERCPVDENLSRPLQDGDQVYLLAPFVGG